MARESRKKTKDIQRIERPRPLSPFDEMERMFAGFYPRGWMSPFHWRAPSWDEFPQVFKGKTPSVDVIEHDNEVVVRAELPGVKKEDLDVSVTDNAVTIKGKTKHEEKEEKGDYYHCEISSGSYARTVALPTGVSTDDAKATFEDGILELILPKQIKAKRHTVKVE